MNKAILVIDMPESCDDCKFCYYSDGRFPACQLNLKGIDDSKAKPEWCPLKPLPERRDSLTVSDWGFEGGFNSGYNTFLKELLNDSSEN